MSKLLGSNSYTLDEAKQVISVGLTHYYFRPDGELDFLAILPDENLIVNIEVKQQISSNPRTAKKLLKDASSQMLRNEKYLVRLFGPMLSPGWRLAKVAVVLPGTIKDGDLCDNCKKFLIDESALKDLPSWWKQSSLENTAGRPNAYNEFLRTMELVVPTKSIGKLKAWTRITGTKNSGPINAGHTKDEPPILGKVKPNSGELEKALNRVHDAEKLIFFSPRQLDILWSSQFSKMVLWGDYGTGK